MTPGSPSWPTTLQPLALVASPRLGLRQLGTERQIVFNIDRIIFDTIVSNMLFDPINKSDNNEDVDVEDHVFGNEAELNVVMRLCLEAAIIAKS